MDSQTIVIAAAYLCATGALLCELCVESERDKGTAVEGPIGGPLLAELASDLGDARVYCDACGLELAAVVWQ